MPTLLHPAGAVVIHNSRVVRKLSVEVCYYSTDVMDWYWSGWNFWIYQLLFKKVKLQKSSAGPSLLLSSLFTQHCYRHVFSFMIIVMPGKYPKTGAHHQTSTTLQLKYWLQHAPGHSFSLLLILENMITSHQGKKTNMMVRNIIFLSNLYGFCQIIHVCQACEKRII